MNVIKIIAIVVIAAGIAGIIYGQFTYTNTTHEARMGPIDISVKEKRAVNVPLWIGVAVVGAGIMLLAVPKPT